MKKLSTLPVTARELAFVADEAMAIGDKDRCIELIELIYQIHSQQVLNRTTKVRLSSCKKYDPI